MFSVLPFEAVYRHSVFVYNRKILVFQQIKPVFILLCIEAGNKRIILLYELVPRIIGAVDIIQTTTLSLH